MEEFIHSSHSLGNNMHHFEWCTKYRYRMFQRWQYAEHCRNIFNIIAREYSMSIEELAVMSEHVHIEVSIPADMSQSKAMQLLKGRSSYELFKAISEFRLRYPRDSLWSKGNFKDSVGRVTAEVVKKYIHDQQASLESFTGNCGLKPAEDVIKL